jgi:hypothetical protein
LPLVIVAMINFTLVNLNICVVRLDGIGLEMTILERVGVPTIVEKVVENRHRWFGHVEM